MSGAYAKKLNSNGQDTGVRVGKTEAEIMTQSSQSDSKLCRCDICGRGFANCDCKNFEPAKELPLVESLYKYHKPANIPSIITTCAYDCPACAYEAGLVAFDKAVEDRTREIFGRIEAKINANRVQNQRTPVLWLYQLEAMKAEYLKEGGS